MTRGVTFTPKVTVTPPAYHSRRVTDTAHLTEDALREAIDAQIRRVRVEQAKLTHLARDAVVRGAMTPGYVAVRCRLPKSVAKRMIANGHALRRMPEVAAAFDAGHIGPEHVAVLAAAQQHAPRSFEKFEPELLDGAEKLRYDAFVRRVRYIEQVAEPDEVEAQARSAHDDRRVHASRSFEDTVVVDGVMDPVGGSVFLNELQRLEQVEFEADWAEARSRLGEAATANDLRRTPAQRRHDALVEMAKRSAAMPESAKRTRYLLTVLVEYETMHGRICELADGTVVTPGQVVPLLDEADVERAVFGPESRVIDLGRRTRLFTGGARRAAQLSDLECTEPTCDVRYERCEVDHTRPWAAGGRTDQDNARLRCPTHHPGRRRPPPRSSDP